MSDTFDEKDALGLLEDADADGEEKTAIFDSSRHALAVQSNPTSDEEDFADEQTAIFDSSRHALAEQSNPTSDGDDFADEQTVIFDSSRHVPVESADSTNPSPEDADEESVEIIEEEVLPIKEQYSFQLIEGEERLSDERIRAEFKHRFQADVLFEAVDNSLKHLASQAGRELEATYLRNRVMMAIDKLVSDFYNQEIEFDLQHKLEAQLLAEKKCQVTLVMKNPAELTETLNDQIQQIETYLSAIMLVTVVNKRLDELKAKRANARPRLEKTLEALKALHTKEVAQNQKGALEKEKRELESEKNNLQRKLGEWLQKTHELNQIILRIETLASEAQDTSEKIATQNAVLLSQFREKVSIPNLKELIQERLSAPVTTIKYLVQYPEVAKRHTLAVTQNEESKKKSIGVHDRRNSIWAMVALVMGTAIAIPAIRALRHNNNEIASVADKAEKNDFYSFENQKARAASCLKNENIPASEIEKQISSAANLEELVHRLLEHIHPLSFVITTNADGSDAKPAIVINKKFTSLMFKIFGTETGVGLIKVAGKKSSAEGDQMTFADFCNPTDFDQIAVEVTPEQSKVIKIEIDKNEVVRLCDTVVRTMRADFGYRSVEEAHGKMKLILANPSANSREVLNKAKQEIRGFVKAMQDQSKIKKDANVSLIEQANDLQALEESLITIMGPDVLTIRRPSAIQSEFFISPEIKTGMSLIHPEGKVRLLMEKEKDQMHTTKNMRVGVGMFTKNICAGGWRFGLVVQPNKDPNSMVYYPYDLKDWVEKNCK